MEEEVWKDIPGYEGLYEVSNLGRIRSLDRYVVNSYHSNGYIKKGGLHKLTCNKKLGYSLTSLSDKNHNKKYLYVHRLVASAFIPNPNNYPVINHIDEDGTNNRVDSVYSVGKCDACQRTAC